MNMPFKCISIKKISFRASLCFANTIQKRQLHLYDIGKRFQPLCEFIMYTVFSFDSYLRQFLSLLLGIVSCKVILRLYHPTGKCVCSTSMTTEIKFWQELQL